MKRNFITTALFAVSFLAAVPASAKERLFVMGDFGAGPESEQSLVRLLVYSNEYDLEGIVATTSVDKRDNPNVAPVLRAIKAYGEVRINLSVHAKAAARPDYPDAGNLEKLVSAGQPAYGVAGASTVSEGARLLARAIAKKDSRPLWVSVWGGANTLLRALRDVKANVSADEFKAVQKRVRVYAVSDRDDAGLAVRKEFPQVLYVVDPCMPGDTGAYPAATWRGLSGDLRTDEFAYPARHMVEDRWLWDCVQTKGPLGKCYPKSPHYVESYTPSFLGLVDNGLGWAQNPTWGGWGGRYRVAQPAGEPHRILTTPSDRDDRDDCGRVRLGGGSVARWREDFQNDFAGRMRWAVTPEKDRANHAPVVVLNGMKGSEVLRIAARTGDTVKLSAAGSFDPDGNKFGYDWWIYREAGMPGGARLNGRGESVELDLGPLPKDAKGTIHVIVRARDGGSPWMASYRRAVVSVEPMPEAKMFIDPGHPGHPDWEAPHRELPDGEFPAPATAYDRKKLRLERFGRGVVAWRDSFDTVCVGWRYFSYDPTNQTFDVYCDGAKVNARPIGNVTQIRLPYKGKATYSVKAHLPTTRVIHGGTSWTVPDDAPIGYIRIPVTPPPGGETRSEKYHMTLNDCSMGDLDGDGVMDIVIKWAPSDGRDNSHPGHTGPTWFEGVKIATGESLWKINLGMNCRSGEHYNPFVVYDFDGDGCAEMIVRSSDGTVDGTGRVLGDPEKLWAEGHGAVIFAPQWYTVFDGKTGRAIDSITMKPDIGRDWRVCRSWFWGDHGNLDGNRPFRFVASFGFLDGERPSAVMCRGYYSRSGIMALDFDGKRLKEKWMFDTLSDMEKWGRYCGQGFHSLRMGDVDFDGKDEVIYGQMVVDHDGQGLHSTGMGHGDALNLIQRTPYTRGLQIWTCQENGVDGAVLRDACTGRVIYQVKSGKDVPRAVAYDMDGCSPGVEMWSASGIGMHDGEFGFHGWPPTGLAFWAYFSGDMTASCVAGNGMWAMCSKTHKQWKVGDFSGVHLINGSKCVPCMQADILGDWREEILMAVNGEKELRLYLSNRETPYRFWTMLEDPPYRESVAAQNSGYNQPPQPGFYFGPDLLGHGIWWRGTYLPKWEEDK